MIILHDAEGVIEELDAVASNGNDNVVAGDGQVGGRGGIDAGAEQIAGDDVVRDRGWPGDLLDVDADRSIFELGDRVSRDRRRIAIVELEAAPPQSASVLLVKVKPLVTSAIAAMGLAQVGESTNDELVTEPPPPR